MKLFDITIKGFLKEKMYYSKEVLKKTNEGKKIIKELFIKINKKPDKFIDMKYLIEKNKKRLICDFIAGMTDRFAIDLYKKIK